MIRLRRRPPEPDETPESRALDRLRQLTREALSKVPAAEAAIDRYEKETRGTSTA